MFHSYPKANVYCDLFRHMVCHNTLDRLYIVANQIEETNNPINLWSNSPGQERDLFFNQLNPKPNELWDLYTYRFLGLDPNVEDHHKYHHWLFDPKWAKFAGNGHNFGYRVYFMLSEFDLPNFEVNCRIDWRRLHRLYPISAVHRSANSFVFWSVRFQPKWARPEPIYVPDFHKGQLCNT